MNKNKMNKRFLYFPLIFSIAVFVGCSSYETTIGEDGKTGTRYGGFDSGNYDDYLYDEDDYYDFDIDFDYYDDDDNDNDDDLYLDDEDYSDLDEPENTGSNNQQAINNEEEEKQQAQADLEAQQKAEEAAKEQAALEAQQKAEEEAKQQAEAEAQAQAQAQAEAQAQANNNQSQTSNNSSFQSRVVELCNERRAAEGIGPLTEDATLDAAAAIRAGECTSKFEHTRPDGTSCFTVIEGGNWKMCGENIAAGQRTPEEVVEAWMNSEGHRANIMNPSFNKIGVGYTTGGSYGNAWVQLFTD